MGLTTAKINLKNSRTGDEINVKAMADTGTLHLCIPQHVQIQQNPDGKSIKPKYPSVYR